MPTDDLLYAPEDSHDFFKNDPWVILIVDDDLEVHSITKLALHDFTYDHRGLLFLSAYSAAEATSLFEAREDIAIVLLDVIMETDTAGLDLVKVIRERFRNDHVRIIIRTGQPGMLPARYVIDHYDINDYKEKTELTTDRLYITIRSSLSQYKHIVELENKKDEIYTALIREYKIKEELKEKEHLLLMQSRQAAMGEMITMIAHQWRQPLTSIATIVMTLQLNEELENSTKEETVKLLGMIANQTQYLSQTISNFRDFFKHDKEIKQIQPSEAIDHAIVMIGSFLEDNGIELHLSLSCSKPFYTLVNELQHVFINLIKNAADTLIEKDQKEKWIRILCKEEDEHITFEISDNGGGIDPSLLNRIFEPYFSTKHEKNGTGLGLYISKTIVEKHLKGTISCENLDTGALFTLKLPLKF